MTEGLVWNVDPVLTQIGPVTVRYYGLCFGLAITTGFAVWYRRVQRFGESPQFAERLLYWGIPAVIVGGRLGYCLLYAPLTYLAAPWRIFAIGEGGIASHGVAAGLAVMLWLFGRRHGVTWTRLGDYLAPAVALAVGWIRVGNFFNSEVVGRPASVPWAIVFARHDAVPRHPAQLYDLLIGPIAFGVLVALERRGIRPIGSGLIAGSFLAVYFSFRIVVEHFRAFSLEQLRELAPFSTVEQWLGAPIHTGQWLSIPPLLGGLYLIARAYARQPAADPEVTQ